MVLKNLADKRVLITGGAGFLGSEVVKQMTFNGAKVTVIDNFSSGKRQYITGLDKVNIVEDDIRDEEVVREIIKDKELVVHAAALPFIPDSYYHPKEFFQVNLIGTLNIMLASMGSETVERFVHISSSEVYGTAKYAPMDEKHPTQPHSTYAASKLAGETSVFTLSKEHEFPVVIIRPFNCYGPNITQPYIIPEIATQLMKRNSVVTLGNIHSRRDLTFVEDTAKGIVLCSILDDALDEVINLGSGVDISMKELAELMASIWKMDIKIEIDESRFRPYDVNRLLCDNSKARRILKWQPQVSLRDGLEKTMRWIANNEVQFKSPFKGWPTYYRKRK